MSHEYDPSQIQYLELGPTRVDELMGRAVAEWTDEDWAYAAFRADDPSDSLRAKILSKLAKELPGTNFRSVLEHWSFLSPESKNELLP